VTRLFFLVLLAAVPTAQWMPAVHLSRSDQTPDDLSELCARVVTGRGSAAQPVFAWHEALLAGFRSPLGPGRDAAGLTPAADPAAVFDGSDERASAEPGWPALTASGRAPLVEVGDRSRTAAAEPEAAGRRASFDRARSLLLAGRAREAWLVLEPLDPAPAGADAFVRGWAAWRSGVAGSGKLLLPFTNPALPLSCRAPAARAVAQALAAADDSAGARRQLEALGTDLPEIRDYVILWRIEGLAATASPRDLEVLRAELAELQPSTSLLRGADLALARAYKRAGDGARAAALLERLLPDTPGVQRPALLAELARLEARAGRRAAAELRLREIADDHPGSAEAEALLETSPAGGVPMVALTPAERAAVLSAHGRVREAVEALTPAGDVETLTARAAIRLRQGDYAGAAADYREAIARGGDAVDLGMEMAKAYGRSGEPVRARELYSSLFEAAPKGPRASTLAYLVADAFQDESGGEPQAADSAASWFRLLVDRFPRSERAPRGLARLAQLRFAAGDTEGAARLFREYLARYPRGEDARAARYWLGRCAQAAGRAGLARARYTEVLRPAPPDYYDLLARHRLAGGGDDTVAALLSSSSTPPPEALRPDPADTLIAGGSPAAPALVRARALLLLGELDAAQREVDEAVRLSGRSREELRGVARWALARGIPESGFRIGWALLASGDDPEATRIAYPPAFADYVLLESMETGVPASLLWAIMRQESSFDPAARSPAGAVGLLQLMPATARGEVDRLGFPDFDASDLSRPEPNLHLGAAHLRDLTDALGGDQAAAVAAYNAGLAMADRWRRFPESRDPEGYVERIPFRETRNYVKVVVANAALYEELYGAP
jgi:soluble lytic murein transglycosylase